MSWRKINGGGPYYERSTRIGNRVVKRYLGKGPKAEKAAREDLERRELRESLRTEKRKEKAKLLEDLDCIKLADKTAADILNAELLTAGFYRQNRAPWKLRRSLGFHTDQERTS